MSYSYRTSSSSDDGWVGVVLLFILVLALYLVWTYFSLKVIYMYITAGDTPSLWQFIYTALWVIGTLQKIFSSSSSKD